MALFDSNKTVFLSFEIHLADPVRVAQLHAQYPDGVHMAPNGGQIPLGGAAVVFEAPFVGYTEAKLAAAPFSTSIWAGLSDTANNPPFPMDVASFHRHTGGFFGLGGTTVEYRWVGEFYLAPDPDGGASPGDQAEIPARRFVEGFETPGLGWSGTTGCSKDASRHVGGMGLAIRGWSNSVATARTSNDLAHPDVWPTRSWERFYWRLRKAPTSTVWVYRTSIYPTPAAGTLLGVTAEGQIAVGRVDAVGAVTFLSTLPGITLETWTGRADHDAWVKIDVLLDVVAGTCRVFVNGAPVSSAGGVGGEHHLSSGMGAPFAVSSDLYLDVDDWINADIPSRLIDGVVTELLNGKDFLNGSKVALVRPSGFSSNHAVAWTGDFRVLAQTAVGFTPATLTSSTNGALAAVETDAAAVLETDPGALGVAAFYVVAQLPSGANGTVGYKIGGAAAATVPLFSAATNTAEDQEPQFPTVTPLELRHTKGAGATTIATLVAQAELIGKWGVEDYRASELVGIETPAAVGTGPHNYPYPRSPWATRGVAPPIAPYLVVGGTYVGTGTGLDLTFRAPVHWLYVRPLAGATGGYLWLSTAIGSHRDFEQGVSPQIVDAQEDPTFAALPGEDAQQQRYRVRIAGNDAQLNALGVTYQYVAVSDPGMRYVLNGTLAHKPTLGPRTHALIAEDYTPDFALIVAEATDSTTTKQLYAKGPGQAVASIVRYGSPAVIADALTFAPGALQTDASFHALGGGQGTTYALWRRHDGSQDTGEAGVVNIGSYTGDGSSSRTINLGGNSGRRPLFAFVFAESGPYGFQRDPSHTTVNSSDHTGTIRATGLTGGGIDQISVGADLNGAGISYTYFVLFADSTACNGGWGCNGEFPPVEPFPPGGPFPPDPTIPDPDVPPTPGPTPGPCPPNDPDCVGPEIAAACKAGTTALVNRALSRIGISKQIADVTSDTSVEAVQALLNYGLDVNRTLRDFPWSFATRYASLVLVAGTSTVPANADWQYAYRAPADMRFARRIVGQGQQRRGPDPHPIQFRLGSDALGGLVYTDAPISTGVPVALEYTVRPTCAAGVPDDLFRDALTWKLAASLAAPLARDSKKVEFCLAMYESVLRAARATDAQEQEQAPAGDVDWISGRL